MQKHGFEFCHKDYKIIWTWTGMQGQHEYQIIHSEQDIMYMYYTMTIQYKKNKKYKTVCGKSICDFPALFSFELMLKEALQEKYSPEWQRDTLRNQEIMFTNTQSTQSSFSEDVYAIRHVVVPIDDYEVFYVTFGGSLDTQCDSDCFGVTLTMQKKDIKELYRIICEFIADAIRQQNEIIRGWKKQYENRVITMYDSHHNDVIIVKNYQNPEYIDDVFFAGDEISCVTVPYEEGDDGLEKSYDNILIEKIDDDWNIVVHGYDGKQAIIQPKDIVYISRDCTPAERSFDEEAIKNDILTKFDFKVPAYQKKKDFIQIYQEMIISRYWMYHSAHPFNTWERNTPKKDAKYRKNVYKIAENILSDIYNLLQEK